MTSLSYDVFQNDNEDVTRSPALFKLLDFCKQPVHQILELVGTEKVMPSVSIEVKNTSWTYIPELMSSIDRQIVLNTAPVKDWSYIIALLLQFEDEKLLVDSTPSDLSTHKAWLDNLRRQGESMIHNASASQIDIIKSHLEIIKLKYLGWHGQMNEDEASRILREVFGANQ